MKKSSIRLYGPLLAIALVQAVFVAVAPSTRPSTDELAVNAGEGGFAAPGADGFALDPDTGLSIDPTTGEAFDPTTGEAVDPATGGPAPDGVAGGPGEGPGVTTPSGNGPAGQAGDTSHCVGDLQFDILLVNPPCKPQWPAGANNGGATYQGVTADTIKVVLFQAAPSPAVDAILASQGLAATEEESDALHAAAIEFINENYELYGRKVQLIEFESSDCPTTPPNVATCKEAAREVIKMKPFMVVWGTNLYPEVFDEFARAGVISVGGWHFDESSFNDRRPYRYDVFMDGTESADHVAEYYCKKLAGKPASHAGTVIHATIGGRDTPRRLGISVPTNPANKRNAERIAAKIEACGEPRPVISTYESDIEKAESQTNATVQRYIDNNVTTVMCMCDPIAPVFLTKGMTRATYYPENLLSGTGLLDYDVLGRLYDTAQWEHAFGPSHLQQPIAFEQQDQSRMWKATGRSGRTCGSCALPWAYMSQMAQMLHNAGPNLNPLTVERGMLSLPGQFSGKPGTVGLQFGQGDYTAISDVKEVYWSNSAVSKIDGKAGAYVALNDAKRYRLGQWPKGLSVPAKAS